MSQKDAYDTLTESLGFPGSARLRSILEMLMTSEEARLAEALPGGIAEVSEKTGIPEDKVRATLDGLYEKGVVFPRGDFANREYYRFARQIIQLHDATQASSKLDLEKDRPLFQKWHDFCKEEMYPRMAAMFKGANARLTRVIPAYRAIKELPDILPAENFHEILGAQDIIAVVPCSCRIRTTAVGEQCQHTAEAKTWHCLQFGRGAAYVINRGSGRKLTLEEALLLCDDVEEDGLIHRWANNANMTGINTSCQCCRDCCEEYVAMDQGSVPVSQWWEKSRYEAYLAEPDDCNGCALCVDRCQFDAVQMVQTDDGLKASVEAEKCFGCGVCVVGCSPEALKMKVVRPTEFIPGVVTG
jgi:electron transport complex protein RnfB